MRKFTTIFMAVVLCIAALTVFAFAAETNCADGEHDWTAWILVKVENGDKYFERTCACGEAEPQVKIEHTHKEETIPAVAATCDQPGLTEGKKCSLCGEITKAQEEVAPIAHTIEHVDAKTVVCGDAEDGNVEYWYCTVCGYAWLDAECTKVTNLKSVVTPAAAEHTVVHVDAVPAYCGAESANIEYWYCTTCGFAWLDAECTKNTNLKAVVLPVAAEHAFEKHEAKESTCFEMGNIAYEICTNCNTVVVDGGVQSNILAVQLPLAHVIEHVEAKAPACETEGNIEYWYCKECGYAWLDEACIKNTNLKAVILPATHAFEHHDAKASTCFEMGNIAYDICTVCNTVEVDGGIKSNILAVMLPLAHVVEHVEAKAATATETGNIEYWYCKECGYAWLDEACTKNTNLKAVILPATGETTDPVNPGTGDNAIFFAVVLVAVAVAGVAVVSFKKREN